MAKQRVEFRYYEMPAGDYILPLLGKGWEINYGNDQPNGMLHFHNFLEIGYCYHGSGRLIIADRTYQYGNDIYTVIPANIPHITISKLGNICKWEFLFIDMDNFIRNELQMSGMDTEEVIRIVNSRGTMKTKANHRPAAMLIRQIIEECREQRPHYREALKGYLRALVVAILRMDEEHQFVSQNRNYNPYVQKSIAYIEKNYADELYVRDIAEYCGLSESHFRRTFEENTNMKPVDYLNLVRVTNACRLLQKKDLSMGNVGKEVGYETVSSFNRNFKAITDMTPLQYKKQAAEQAGSHTHFKITAKPGWKVSDWADRYKEIWEELDREEANQKGQAEEQEDSDDGL